MASGQQPAQANNPGRLVGCITESSWMWILWPHLRPQLRPPGEVSCPSKPCPNFRFMGKINDRWLKPLSFGVVRYAMPDNQNTGVITYCPERGGNWGSGSGNLPESSQSQGVAWLGPRERDPEPLTTALGPSYSDQPDGKPKLRHGTSLTQDPPAGNCE